MPYRGNGASPPWADSISQPFGPLLGHEGRISALETTAEHHHDRLEDLEEAAEEFRRHASRSLGSILESWLPDIKWLLIIALLLGGKFGVPPIIQEIIQAVGVGGAAGTGFGG
jgi:hypothetical protein